MGLCVVLVQCMHFFCGNETVLKFPRFHLIEENIYTTAVISMYRRSQCFYVIGQSLSASQSIVSLAINN